MKRTKSVLMKWMARSLVRLIPMGEAAVDFTTDVLPTMSEEVYGWWTGTSTPEERRTELEELAQADKLEVQSEIEAAIEDAAQDAGAPLDPARREKVIQYLEQVPDAIRRSMRRPEDSKGRTVPPHLAPRTSAQLAALLPQRPPRFKVGQRPIPGVDIELVSPLGAGGFGEVWRARKTHLGQDVALKFCLDPEASASLRNETSLLRRLMSGDAMHPGIVRLIGTYNDCTALEYEFVEGGDLAGLIREWHADGKRPPAKVVIDTIRQIAEIVAFAHQLEPPLVHRDLKPANILVQRKTDGTFRFRLTDFGIGGIAAAKQVAATHRGNVTPSATTSLHGSYSFLYASPQQMRAERPDPTDDVYSLGVIFWQLANGDMSDGAPGGTSWTDDLKAEGYPSAAVTLLASCFDRRPDRRPANAGAFASALKAAPPPPMPGHTPGSRASDVPNKADSSSTQRQSIGSDPRTAIPPMQPMKPMPPMQGMKPIAPMEPMKPMTPLTPTSAKETASKSDITSSSTVRLPPSLPKKSSATTWIILIAVFVVLMLSCVIGSIIIAAIDSAQSADDGATIEGPSTDPKLQGWNTVAGDAFVTATSAADGSPVVVVQNAGANVVIHRDGTRVPVFYDSSTNLWQPAR